MSDSLLLKNLSSIKKINFISKIEEKIFSTMKGEDKDILYYFKHLKISGYDFEKDVRQWRGNTIYLKDTLRNLLEKDESILIQIANDFEVNVKDFV